MTRTPQLQADRINGNSYISSVLKASFVEDNRDTYVWKNITITSDFVGWEGGLRLVSLVVKRDCTYIHSVPFCYK